MMYAWRIVAVALLPTIKSQTVATIDTTPTENCSVQNNNIATYNGLVSKTIRGYTCQRWDENDPHIPSFKPVPSNHNYCRGPDDDEPWCYTTDPNRRWDYCDVGTVNNLKCIETCNAQSRVAVDVKIVGGTPATPTEYKFMVSLRRSNGQSLCAGALIAPDLILSAAHCTEFVGGALVGIYYRESSKNDPPIPVIEKFDHPNYNTANGLQNNDIAIYRLQNPVANPVLAYPNIIEVLQKYSIPTTPSSLEQPNTCLNIAGWGVLNEEGTQVPDVLMKAAIPVNENSYCLSKYANLKSEIHLCASHIGQGGIDTCQGDSGGPLFKILNGYPVVVGVTSFGIGCGRLFDPGVYTRVSSYQSFICQYISCTTVPTTRPSSQSPTFRLLSLAPTNRPTERPTSQSPTRRPTKEPSASPSVSPTSLAPTQVPPTGSSPTTSPSSTAPPTTGSGAIGFDFGDLCQSGSNSVVKNSVQGETVTVGMIPKGRFYVRIETIALQDVDVQLVDLETGTLVVGYTGSGGQSSLLGSAGFGKVEYRGMTIYYSGYNGIDGSAGNEFVEINGPAGTLSSFQFKLYTFKINAALSTSVTMTYSWQKSRTPCCLGLAPCTGTFLVSVNQADIVDLGIIPRGKGDVSITLESVTDVDIQLYDKNATHGPTGQDQAIIGVCFGANCNLGVIASAGESSQSYWSNVYTYSGFNGDGRGKGYEFVKISGFTNHVLEMKAYGFEQGVARVDYTYLQGDAFLSGASSTFDFGDSCKAGSGSASIILTRTGESTPIGVIPKDQRDLYVTMTSDNPNSDIDLQVFDLDDTAQYFTGKAVVADCNIRQDPNCNIGIIASSGIETATYKNNLYEYSGYLGMDGFRGKESIRISGDLNTRVLISAYAYSTGSARVNYSWSASQSACCLGQIPCTGSFNIYVPRQEVIVLGKIPAGKRDVRIQLTSTSDIDIQLYDTANNQAIVAFLLDGSSLIGTSPTLESTTYKGLTYTYSGFGGVNGQPGNEFIKIEGTTNTELEMRVYGYTGGTSTVDYSYTNVVASAQRRSKTSREFPASIYELWG